MKIVKCILVTGFVLLNFSGTSAFGEILHRESFTPRPGHPHKSPNDDGDRVPIVADGIYFRPCLFGCGSSWSIDVSSGVLVVDSSSNGPLVAAEILATDVDGGELPAMPEFSWRTLMSIDVLNTGGVAGVGSDALEYARIKNLNGSDVVFDVGQRGNFSQVALGNINEFMGKDLYVQFDIVDNTLTGHMWPADDPSTLFSATFNSFGTNRSPHFYNRLATSTYEHAILADEPMPLPGQGDYNVNGIIDAGDIDLLSQEVLKPIDERTTIFDLNSDSMVNSDDRRTLVEGPLNTYFGDSNLDGEFNSGDFTDVFKAGEYEDGIEQNSTWATGDWNGDLEFGTEDFVVAFQHGGYEQGPQNAIQSVAEPSPTILSIFGLTALLFLRK